MSNDTIAGQPLVSVVTPVFDMAHTLRRAFESLRAQTGRWQHIIIDDGSADDTPRVIKAIAQDTRVVSGPVRRTEESARR